MPISDNRVILNKYRILQLISQGGKARIWLAKEGGFARRQVAIREPLLQRSEFDADEIRHRNEQDVLVCAVLSEAGATNFVRAITTEIYESNSLLVMEYASGGDLAGLLKQSLLGLTVTQAVTIALEVLATLAAAHNHPWEIVHRNIKPSNILFDDQGRALLSDFGLAQISGTSQRNQAAGQSHPGTPAYMAPEQANSTQTLTPAADVYAAGTVLFEMLTGKRYSRVRPGTAPSALNASVAVSLDAVLAKALDTDPWNRYETAGEFATALSDAHRSVEQALETFVALRTELWGLWHSSEVKLGTQQQNEAARKAAVAKQMLDNFQDSVPISQAEGIALLRNTAGKYAADETAASEIVSLCGGLPVAIFVAGSYLAQCRQEAHTCVVWLNEQGIASVPFDRRPIRSTALLLKRNLEQVSVVAQSAFGVAGILAVAPFAGEIVAASLEMSSAVTDRALEELVNYGLLLRFDDSYRVTHSHVHTYARVTAEPGAETIVRTALWYAAFAESQSEGGPDGLAALDHQRPHIVAVQAAALKAKQWDAVQRITWNLDDYLELKGYSSDRTAVIQNGLEAARSSGARRNEGAFLTLLGMAYAAKGETHHAIEWLERALTTTREIGDHNGESTTLHNLGVAYYSLGKNRRAIKCYKQALAIYRELGDRGSEGAVLGDLGCAYAALDDKRCAIKYYEQHLAVMHEIDDPYAESTALNDLGVCYYSLGQPHRATDYYEQALTVLCEISYPKLEAIVNSNLGHSYTALGEPRRAVTYFEQELAIARKIWRPQ